MPGKQDSLADTGGEHPTAQQRTGAFLLDDASATAFRPPNRSIGSSGSWSNLSDTLEDAVLRPIRSARSMVEDHFSIDETFRLLGPLAHNPDIARDAHDWFNLVALIPVVFFNLLGCWHRDVFTVPAWRAALRNPLIIEQYWHGRYFDKLHLCMALYIIIDTLWIWAAPKCVRSPKTIIAHHLFTGFALVLPLSHPEYAWTLAACLTVELNTWLLIARRAFNRKGHSPWFSVDLNLPVSEAIRIKLISVGFYVTWISIRMILMPLVWVALVQLYFIRTAIHGPLNLLTIAVPIELFFLVLNTKWTIDLIRSKLKNSRAPVSKGL